MLVLLHGFTVAHVSTQCCLTQLSKMADLQAHVQLIRKPNVKVKLRKLKKGSVIISTYKLLHNVALSIDSTWSRY